MLLLTNKINFYLSKKLIHFFKICEMYKIPQIIMRVTKEYLQSPPYEFYLRNSNFWSTVSLKPKMQTYDELSAYIPTFTSLCEIIRNNICNFDDVDLEKINGYMCDIVAESTGIHRILFEDTLQYMMSLQKQCIFAEQRNKQIHDEIVGKMNRIHTVGGKGSKIECPIKDVFLSQNFMRISYISSNDPYVIMWELRKKSQIYHYYVMLYVFDLSIRLQEIRNTIFKYELARNHKYSGTVLDVLVDEQFVTYMDINQELRKYSKKLKETCFYTHHPCMYPGPVYVP